MRCSTNVLNLSFAALAAVLLAPTGAMAKTCELSIEGSDAMQYNTKELTVGKDCTDVTVTLKHIGKLPKAAMGHDWTLVAEKDLQEVAKASMNAGLANDYQLKDDKRIIASTKLIGGGETATASFKVADLKPGETYKFFCTFPGHSSMMNGVLKVEGSKAKS